MSIHDLNRLIEEIEASPDGPARNLAITAVRTVLNLHRDAFERLVVILKEENEEELLQKFLEDPLIGTLLHGYSQVPDQEDAKGLVQLSGPPPSEGKPE